MKLAKLNHEIIMEEDTSPNVEVENETQSTNTCIPVMAHQLASCPIKAVGLSYRKPRYIDWKLFLENQPISPMMATRFILLIDHYYKSNPVDCINCMQKWIQANDIIDPHPYIKRAILNNEEYALIYNGGMIDISWSKDEVNEKVKVKEDGGKCNDKDTSLDEENYEVINPNEDLSGFITDTSVMVPMTPIGFPKSTKHLTPVKVHNLEPTPQVTAAKSNVIAQRHQNIMERKIKEGKSIKELINRLGKSEYATKKQALRALAAQYFQLDLDPEELDQLDMIDISELYATMLKVKQKAIDQTMVLTIITIGFNTFEKLMGSYLKIDWFDGMSASITDESFRETIGAITEYTSGLFQKPGAEFMTFVANHMMKKYITKKLH